MEDSGAEKVTGRSLYFIFTLLLGMNTSQAFVCDIGNPNINDFQSILKVIEEPDFDPLFCKGMDLCMKGNLQAPVPETSTCETANAMAGYGTSTLSERQLGNCGLTREEISAIVYYTRSGYSCLNSVLRKKIDNPALNKVVATLNSALSKLPSYKGFVMRGAKLPQAIRDQHQEGSVVTYEAFTSSSSNSGFGGEDIFIIFSKTGKPIMGFSNLEHEYEVLFKSGVQYKVLKKIEKDGSSYYVMKEVSEQKSKAEDEAEDKETLDHFLANKDKVPQNSIPDVWKCPKENPTLFEKEILQKSLPSFRLQP